MSGFVLNTDIRQTNVRFGSKATFSWHEVQPNHNNCKQRRDLSTAFARDETKTREACRFRVGVNTHPLSALGQKADILYLRRNVSERRRARVSSFEKPVGSSPE